MNKRKKYLILAIIVACAFAIVGPLIINECYKSNSGYITLWSPADMLAYYGVVLGALVAIITVVVTIGFTRKQIQMENFLKQTLKIEKEHPGTFPVETIAFDYDVLKRTNGLHLDDLSKRIAEQNHQLVNAYQEMYRPLLQLKGSIFSKIYSETGESADNILGFERKNQ